MAVYNITITPPDIAEPVFTPVAGQYADSIEVTLSSETEGATIYYTLDGSVPGIEALIYDMPFVLTESTVVTAVAVAGTDSSDVVSAAYTITVTPIEVATPVITPFGGEYADSVVVSISCETSNAVIYYTTDGTTPTDASMLYTGSFVLTENTTVKAIAYLKAFSSAVAETQYTITITPVPVEVATLAELRAGATDGTLYHFSGEAVVTFVQAYRGQKFIQDETAAVLIDDSKGIITTSFKTGDGINDLTGTLYDYYGLLEFVPTTNATPVSTSKTIEPQEITVSEFNTNFEKYESELIQFAKVHFDSPSTFNAGTDYTITDDSTESTILRSHFYDADYIGTGMISGSMKVTGIALWHSNKAKILPRMATDMEDLTSVAGFYSNVKIFAAKKIITILKAEDNSTVEIYSSNGRKVKSANAQAANVSVNMDKAGLYLVVLKSGQQIVKVQKVAIQ